MGSLSKLLSLGSSAMMLVNAVMTKNSQMFAMSLLSLVDGIGEIAKIKELDMDEEREARLMPDVERFTTAIFREMEIGIKKK